MSFSTDLRERMGLDVGRPYGDTAKRRLRGRIGLGQDGALPRDVQIGAEGAPPPPPGPLPEPALREGAVPTQQPGWFFTPSQPTTPRPRFVRPPTPPFGPLGEFIERGSEQVQAGWNEIQEGFRATLSDRTPGVGERLGGLAGAGLGALRIVGSPWIATGQVVTAEMVRAVPEFSRIVEEKVAQLSPEQAANPMAREQAESEAMTDVRTALLGVVQDPEAAGSQRAAAAIVGLALSGEQFAEAGGPWAARALGGAALRAGGALARTSRFATEEGAIQAGPALAIGAGAAAGALAPADTEQDRARNALIGAVIGGALAHGASRAGKLAERAFAPSDWPIAEIEKELAKLGYTRKGRVIYGPDGQRVGMGTTADETDYFLRQMVSRGPDEVLTEGFELPDVVLSALVIRKIRDISKTASKTGQVQTTPEALNALTERVLRENPKLPIDKVAAVIENRLFFESRKVYLARIQKLPPPAKTLEQIGEELDILEERIRRKYGDESVAELHEAYQNIASEANEWGLGVVNELSEKSGMLQEDVRDLVGLWRSYNNLLGDDLGAIRAGPALGLAAGAITGAAVPAESEQERIRNMLLGAFGGAVVGAKVTGGARRAPAPRGEVGAPPERLPVGPPAIPEAPLIQAVTRADQVRQDAFIAQDVARVMLGEGPRVPAPPGAGRGGRGGRAGAAGVPPPGGPPSFGGPPLPPPEGPVVGRRGRQLRARLMPSERHALGEDFEKSVQAMDLPQSGKDEVLRWGINNAQDIGERRRFRITWDSVRMAVSQAGMDVAEWEKVRSGTAANAEQMFAVFKAAVAKSAQRSRIEDELRRLALAGQTPSVELKSRFLTVALEQKALYAVFMGFRAEAGRSLNVLKMTTRGEGVRFTHDLYSRLVQAVGGQANADQIIGQYIALRSRNAGESAYWDLIRQIGGPIRWGEYPNAIFINGILANPLTQFKNIAGQEILLLADDAAKYPTAIIEELRTFGGRRGERSITLLAAMRGTLALLLAHQDAAKAAMAEIRLGVPGVLLKEFERSGRVRRQAFTATWGRSTPLFAAAGGAGGAFAPAETEEERLRNIVIGATGGALARRFINLPTQMLNLEDTFFYTLAQRRSLYEQATTRVQQNRAHYPGDFWTEVAHLASVTRPTAEGGPTQAMLRVSNEAGLRAGLRTDPGGWIKELANWRDKELGRTGLRPLLFIVPFINTPTNLLRIGAEFSPYGFIRAVRATDPGARSEAIGRALVGSAIASYFWQQGQLGNLTGPLPRDPGKAAEFMRSGRRPYSIRVGDQWFEYGTLEPVATPIKWIGALWQTVAENPGLDWSSLAIKISFAIAQAVSDTTWTESFEALFRAWSDPEYRGSRYVGRIASGMIPYSGLLRYGTQATDPWQRRALRGGPVEREFAGFVPSPEVQELIQQIEAGIPGYSGNVPVILSQWGTGVQRAEQKQGPLGAANPIFVSNAQTDPVTAEIAKYKDPDTLDPQGNPLPASDIIIGMVGKEIADMRLTPEEAYRYQQVAGQAMYQRLERLFNGRSLVNGAPFAQLAEREKVRAIHDVTGDARRIARGQVADEWTLGAKTSPQRARAIVMRWPTLAYRSQRAEYAAGLAAAGLLDKTVRRVVDEQNQQRDPTEFRLERYLEAAPLVARYAALPKYRGPLNDPARVAEYDKARAELSRIRREQGDRAALVFSRTNPWLRMYSVNALDPRRAAMLRQYDWLRPFTSGVDEEEE